MFLCIGGSYLFIALCFYVGSVCPDYYKYMVTGYTDHKFPVNCWEVQKIFLWLSILWLPCMLGLLYCWLIRKDHEHKGS